MIAWVSQLIEITTIVLWYNRKINKVCWGGGYINKMKVLLNLSIHIYDCFGGNLSAQTINCTLFELSRNKGKLKKNDMISSFTQFLKELLKNATDQ